MSIDRTIFYDRINMEADHPSSYGMNYRSMRSDRLTPREREVIMLVGQGMTDQEIAAQLSLSVRTVQNHLHRSYSKLRVNNRMAAVQVMMCRQPPKEREGA